MVRPASSIGRKWESAFQDSVEDAIDAFTSVVPQLADLVIAAKADAVTNYGAAVNSVSYDQAVRRGLAPGKADVAYQQRLTQIGMTGFTEQQKEKMVRQTEVRRHLSSLIPAIIVLADGSAGEVKFPADIGNGTKRFLINSALTKYVDRFSTSTSQAEAYTVIKAEIANLDSLTLGA